ncbi:MAG: hypothetical protein V3V20_02060 [Algisphaera sp.]
MIFHLKVSALWNAGVLFGVAMGLAAWGAQAHPDAPHAAPLYPAWVAPPLLAAPAPPKPVDPPLRLTVTDAAGDKLRGAIEAFDEEGFMFVVSGVSEVPGQDATRRLPWEALDPRRVLRVHERLLDRDDAERWLGLGARLYLRGADEAGESALERALRADDTLAQRAERARKGESIEPLEESDDGEAADEEGGGATLKEGPRVATAGPRNEGPPQAAFWGTLTDEVMQSSTEALLRDADGAGRRMGVRLTVYRDSKYYLFVSDMPAAEARRWAKLLDRMYDRLCDTFAVPRGTNVFRGHGLIYVFQREEDFHRYHRLITGFPSQRFMGLCSSRGDGRMEITFYRQSDDNDFAYVLVHEAVHGFLHRYRSFPFVVSWANEGLAEFIADDFVGRHTAEQTRSYVSAMLRSRGSTGGMLGDEKISGWQYPVAQALCDFMVSQDRKRYCDFINAVKDGKAWRQALAEDYGVSIDRLVEAFGDALGIRGLRH